MATQKTTKSTKAADETVSKTTKSDLSITKIDLLAIALFAFQIYLLDKLANYFGFFFGNLLPNIQMDAKLITFGLLIMLSVVAVFTGMLKVFMAFIKHDPMVSLGLVKKAFWVTFSAALMYFIALYVVTTLGVL